MNVREHIITPEEKAAAALRASRVIDKPLKPGEIELRGGGLAHAPKRIHESQAVKPLRDVEAELNELQASIDQAAAALALKRAEALELQDNFDALNSMVAMYREDLAVANGRLAQRKARMAEIDAFVDDMLGERDVRLHDHRVEYDDLKFEFDRLPKFIKAREAMLADAEKRLAAFKTKHEIIGG